MDAALRTQLKTLSTDTRGQAQKGQGVSQEFLATQKAGYACENMCRDANYGMYDAVLDTVDTDSSGAGKALKAALGNIKTAQADVATKGATALTDSGGWVSGLGALRAQYATIIAAAGPGPIADAVGQGMSLLDSATATGKSVKFDPSSPFSRFAAVVQSASGFADDVSADVSPAKGGRNVSFSARNASANLNEMNGLLAQVGAGAEQAGLTQIQAAQLCWQAADQVDRLLYP